MHETLPIDQLQFPYFNYDNSFPKLQPKNIQLDIFDSKSEGFFAQFLHFHNFEGADLKCDKCFFKSQLRNTQIRIWSQI